MMKFFRKHMKEMLAVFMALLLVVWLGGTALTSSLKESTGEEIVRGSIYGREVMQGEIGRTNYHAETLNVIFSPRWRDRLSVGRDKQLDDLEFFMLVTEAIENGVRISPAQIDKNLEAIPPASLDYVRKSDYNRSIQRIREALEVFLMVRENMIQASIAAQPSEADIQNVIRQIAEKVDTSVVVIPARDFINETYEPSDEELSQHFEKYKNEPQNYEFLEFGYQLEDAVQVEYIRVDTQILTAQQSVAEQEAYDYWKAHPKEFLAPPPATQPATTQAAPPKGEPYETFTEAKADVLKKLQNQKGKDAAMSAARELISLLGLTWADAPTTQPDGYKEPPASEKAQDIYQKLIDRMQGKYAGILKYGRTEVITRKQPWRTEEIGQTSAMMGTPSQSSFAQVAFMVPGTSASPEEDKARARFFRNIWETCSEPLIDGAGNAFVIRTVAARPAQAPASFADVREDLVRDLRRQLAYTEAEQAARKLVDNIGNQDLDAAFEANAELVSKLGRGALRELPPFSRAQLAPYSPDGLMPSRVPGMTGDEEFIDLCFASPEEARYIKIHERKNVGQWVVLQRHKIVPVNRTEFEEQREAARNQLMRKAMTDFSQGWLTAEKIHKRVKWVSAEPPAPTKKEGEEKEAEGEAAKTAS